MGDLKPERKILGDLELKRRTLIVTWEIINEVRLIGKRVNEFMTFKEYVERIDAL